jgi:hypothetical protein
MSDFDEDKKVTYFGETDFRNKKTKFGIQAKDRTRHMYIIGKTGTGKSTLLENLVIQDIQNGEGVCVIDPHGSLAEKALEYVPEDRINDVIYFAPFDTEYPMSFNVLEDIGVDKRHLVVSGLMSVFKKIWQDAWSARMEYILNNTLLALIEYPGSTLMGVNKMYSDKEFRKKIVDNIKDPAVKSFWVDEYAKYTDKFASEATPAIQNKIGQYTLNPLIRNIIGQPTSSFDIREIMDKKKIFIINLSKGRIGEQNMNLLGGMFVTKIYLAAMSRAEISQSEIDKLPPFYFYVDEFQNFANESFAQILSEARKYKLCLTVANQYVTQMVDEVRDAILGNVGSMVTFRIGPSDAEIFEKEFAPTFTAQDLTNLGFAQVYLRLMIGGMTSKPFSANTLPPWPKPEFVYLDKMIDASRRNYARPKAEVENEINSWHGDSSKPEKSKETDTVAKREYDTPREGGMRKPFLGKIENAYRPPAKEYNPPAPQTTVRETHEIKKTEHTQSFDSRTTNNFSAPKQHTPRVDTPKPVNKKPVFKPHTPEVKITPKESSPKLKEILTVLESPTENKTHEISTTKETHVVEKKETTNSTPMSLHMKNNEPVSLSALNASKKDPTPEKKAELKALLSRVLKKETTTLDVTISNEKTTSEEKFENTPKSEPHVSIAQEKRDARMHTQPDPSSQKTREVPEDVLRKILGTTT